MAGGAAPACGLDGGKHRVNPEIKAQRARGEPSGRAESRQGNGPGASSKPSRQASAAHPELSRAFQAFHRPDRLKFLCAGLSRAETKALQQVAFDQLAEAQLKGRWTPSEISEERRLNLLPRSPARPWDELVRSADYMQALDRLP